MQALKQLTPLELEVREELLLARSEALEKAAHEEISQLEQQLQLNRNEQQDVTASRTMLDMTAVRRVNDRTLSLVRSGSGYAQRASVGITS